MKKNTKYIISGLLLICLLLIANLFSPFKLGSMSTCLLELHSDGGKILLPVEYGLFARLPKTVELLSSDQTIVGVGQVAGFLNTDSGLLKKRGNISVNVNFTTSIDTNAEIQIQELRMIYKNKTVSYPGDNMILVKGAAKRNYNDSGLDVTMSVSGCGQISMILYTVNEVNIVSMGVFQNIVASENSFPLQIAKKDGQAYLPLEVTILENQFVVLKPLIYTETGSTGMTMVIPPIAKPQYTNGTRVKQGD